MLTPGGEDYGSNQPSGDILGSRLSERSPLIEVRPIAGSIGAVIRGVGLDKAISDSNFVQIEAALYEHLVIFLPSPRPLSPAHLRNFAARFGNLDEAPFVYPFRVPPVDGYPEIFTNIKEAHNEGFNIGGFWHADVTYRPKPHKASVLYAKETPAVGGDTMFANQYLAYESLEPELKQKLLSMNAIHSSAMPHGRESARFATVSRQHAPKANKSRFHDSGDAVGSVEVIENTHPVVRTHPVTGKRVLYVNRGFTSRFEGMSEAESLPLLEQLWAHQSQPEFTCRYRWSPYSVAVWDNCAAHHYAINDYFGERRHMQRIAIHED